jgi:hypothetical protein
LKKLIRRRKDKYDGRLIRMGFGKKNGSRELQVILGSVYGVPLNEN